MNAVGGWAGGRLAAAGLQIGEFCVPVGSAEVCSLTLADVADVAVALHLVEGV